MQTSMGWIVWSTDQSGVRSSKRSLLLSRRASGSRASLAVTTALDGEALGPTEATCVYRRIDGTWRLVHPHWSILRES